MLTRSMAGIIPGSIQAWHLPDTAMLSLHAQDHRGDRASRQRTSSVRR